MPKDTRQIFCPSYYVIKVHDQYNKDNIHQQHLSYKNQIIPGYSTQMRVNIYSPYPKLFILNESKSTLALSQVIQSG
jgi:hypothetical protein